MKGRAPGACPFLYVWLAGLGFASGRAAPSPKALAYTARPLFKPPTSESFMSKTKNSGIAIATAAAVLFSAVPALNAVAADAKIKCDGGNSCKGKSECSTATNACAGQNSCKGTGYVTLPKDECPAAQAANKPADKS